MLSHYIPLIISPFLFSALVPALALPVNDASLQPVLRSEISNQNNVRAFIGSETVFEIAEEFSSLRTGELSRQETSQDIHEQIISEDVVSTQFRTINTNVLISISGGLWGYNQKPGYYRSARGTVSNDRSAVEIANDILSLSPEELKDHVTKSIEGLNNLTYPLLAAKICGGTPSILEVLASTQSSEAMMAKVANKPAGLSIALQSGSPQIISANEDFIAIFAMAFLSVMNHGILQRISEKDGVDRVDALIIEIYLALGHRFAVHAQQYVHGDCIAPKDAVAGMNALNVILEEAVGSRTQEELVPEL